ncbi:MAG: hypothetical protein NT045_07345 [Candidatus Aureabacteria bacterium]|nr:hypothetical protein [Candidatus Auribacterota bacterium]
MKLSIIACVAIAVCVWSGCLHAEEVIHGDTFQAFRVSPDRYMGRPVVLEDTFENIVERFSRIETVNFYTADRYLKFRLGQLPYPCIGMRTAFVQDALNTCTPGDHVRVQGSLMSILEARTRETTRGKYTGGRSWEERVYVYGPRESEIIFLASRVERGWGSHDSPEEMFEEGTNLKEEQYQEVTPAVLGSNANLPVERPIWFEGEYGGMDESFSDLEKAAGMTPQKVIKLAMRGVVVPCYLPMNDANMAGLRMIPPGNKLQVYGRIRVKETQKGKLNGFVVDRVTKTVVREAASPGPSSAPRP